MTSSLASALIEHEQLSFMENVFQKLLHSADQLIGELGRILGPRKERKAHSTPETSATTLLPFPQTTRLAEVSHLPYELLVGEEEPSDEFMVELSKQPVEILAEIDKWWLSEVLKPCRKLVANPGDVTARDEVNRWAKRRKCILYTMFRERPIDLLQLASIRVLPQHEDGKLNPRLINLPRELKLSPEQHDALLVKWQAYKLKVKEAFSNASASTSKASMSLTALDGIDALKLLKGQTEIHASEFVTYCWDFVGALKLSQRASMVVACAPYGPDPLQISAVLFDSLP